MLDILILFAGLLGEKCKETNARIKGREEYKKYMELSVWDKARQSSILEINDHKYFWVKPYELDISEAFWKSGKPLYDFLIDYYFERDWLPMGGFRVFLKSGDFVQMFEFEVMEEWRKRVEKRMNDCLRNTTLPLEEFCIKFYDMILKENKHIEYYMDFDISVNGDEISLNGGDMENAYKNCPKERLASIIAASW